MLQPQTSCVLNGTQPTFMQGSVFAQSVLGGAVEGKVGADDDACTGGRPEHALVQVTQHGQAVLQACCQCGCTAASLSICKV